MRRSDSSLLFHPLFNPFSENIVNISNRLNKHFAAAAVVTAAVVGSADAGIVYSGIRNISVNAAGMYLNVETGPLVNGQGLDLLDIFFWNPGTHIALYAANGTTFMATPGATSDHRIALAADTTIGASASFYPDTISYLTVGNGFGQIALNSSVFVGFKFVASDALNHYGWMRFTVGANAGIATMVDWAYDSTAGASIDAGAGAVPAPGALALLGLAGLAGRRRRA